MPVRFADRASGADPYRLTIGELLPGTAPATLILSGSRRLSYSELRERIGRLASALAGLGVGEGSTVGILDWDSHRYLEAYFAVPMMGAVLQTVNVRLAPAQIAYTIRHASAEVLLVHRDFLPLVEAIRGELPQVRAVVALADDERLEPGDLAGEYENLLAASSPSYDFPSFDENAIATTFYTTGTTGLPKAVCFSHRQIVLHTLAVAAAVAARRPTGFGYADVYMPLTPMFHVHAWGFPYIATMLGLKQVYPGRYDADRIVRLRRDEGVTISHGVPTILQMVLDAAVRSDQRLDDWTMIIGGAALTADLHTTAAQLGLNLIAGYGMSETGPVISIATTTSAATSDTVMATRAGLAIPLVRARIVDDEMQQLASDGRTQGELVVRAPWLTPCYVGDEGATEELWSGGWLHTRDVATLDPDGGIRIRDRLKDVIKSGGEWICSLTLEELVLADPRVREVAIVAKADPRWGERPVAFVVIAERDEPTLPELNEILQTAANAGKISRYAMLDQMEIVGEIPRTSVGKQDKKALRARF